MRDDQVQSVLARLGKDRGNGIRRKVLKLIDIKVEIAPGGPFRNVGTGERGHEQSSP